MIHSQPRHRKVAILTPQGFEKLQAAISRTDSWNDLTQSCTLETLSEHTGLSTHTLSKVHTRKAGVDLRTLTRYFRAFNLTLETSDYIPPIRADKTLEPVTVPPFKEAPVRESINPTVSWGMAPDVSGFYGRTTELATLSHEILDRHCRLVTLIGMGGIGKTWLATKLAEQTQHQFQSVIWRSLRSLPQPPALNDFLDDLLRHLAPQPEPNLPETTYAKIGLLFDCLSKTRCLLVLDNAESILQGAGKQAAHNGGANGIYRCDYEDYGELFRLICQGRHQSCVVLTSREEPKTLRPWSGDDPLGVRLLAVPGLQLAELQPLLKVRGIIHGEATEWSRLITYYGGNPLFLKIVATTIQQLFDGSLTAFFSQNTLMLDEIRELLDQQFDGLSAPAQDLMRILAAQDTAFSLLDLRSQISPKIPNSVLLATLKSLKARSLIQSKNSQIYLQPFMEDYMRDRFALAAGSWQGRDCA